MTHTPGPWRAILSPFNDGAPYHRINAGAGHYHNQSGFNLTGVISPDDVALIAAAPSLLAALKLAEELLARIAAQRDTTWDGIATPTSVLGEARAAIAKAEGLR